MRTKNGLAAFTLIELLIVVAIIAILAAIAVPNLLEAQVRGKVSRVKADLRSYATALEAYRVDNNDYPPLVIPWIPPGFPKALEEGLIPLSTPISYISQALLPEPFNSHRGWALYRGWDVVEEGGPPPDAGQRQAIYFYLPFPNGEMMEAGIPLLDLLLVSVGINTTDAELREMLSKGWVMGSPGPDTFFRFDQYLAISGPGDFINAIFEQMASISLPQQGKIYDPTNGTVSIGDIARNGGGLAMDKR